MLFYLNTYGVRISKYLDPQGRLVNSKIYNEVGLSRDIFSKMTSKDEYFPDKINVCKIAFALHLNLGQTNYLLGRVGYVLSDCIEFDIILVRYINNGCYDVNRLDEELYKNGFKTFLAKE